ncbi:hypothetical protein RvY_15193 [Ramazzottius varieornatus]|uniref:RING-type domain-containing protein n=1 Tax=Ramazzottius varieornatus TaxID=947166 RepID=A0A1D1VVD4_RAMVA|nr:hypothetical protein RvY_15193 [Ramazzottius varieornatus]
MYLESWFSTAGLGLVMTFCWIMGPEHVHYWDYLCLPSLLCVHLFLLWFVNKPEQFEELCDAMTEFSLELRYRIRRFFKSYGWLLDMRVKIVAKNGCTCPTVKRNEERVEAVPQNEIQCLVCLSNSEMVVLIPCGHIHVCRACILRLHSSDQKTCPYCSVPTEKWLRVYY